MLNRSIQRKTAAIVALIFLAGSLSPPAISHSHDAGEISHVHDSHTIHLHLGHEHYEYGEHSHSHVEHPFANHVPHFHLCVFGWNLTLPSGCHGSNESECEHPANECFVCLASGVTLKPHGNLQTSLDLLLLAAHSPTDGAASQRYVVNITPQTTSAPLCDRARLERTGVRRA